MLRMHFSGELELVIEDYSN